MQNSRHPHSDRRRAVARTRFLLFSAISIGLLGACADDADDVSDGTVVVDEDFPGDALDATCARLEAAGGDDREATAAALLEELTGLGGEELAVNTMEMAVIDACPEWAEPVTGAIESRP